MKLTTRRLILIAVALVAAGYLIDAALGSSNSLPADIALSEDTPQAASPVGDVIGVDELPPEALETLDLIDNDGPFPYSKDGAIFHNYEGLLPAKKDGYYCEYTVITPGASDRGARRIVTGQAGEKYYTDDHYSTFRLIVE